jgi:hypothetical protein
VSVDAGERAVDGLARRWNDQVGRLAHLGPAVALPQLFEPRGGIRRQLAIAAQHGESAKVCVLGLGQFLIHMRMVGPDSSRPVLRLS